MIADRLGEHNVEILDHLGKILHREVIVHVLEDDWGKHRSEVSGCHLVHCREISDLATEANDETEDSKFSLGDLLLNEF